MHLLKSWSGRQNHEFINFRIRRPKCKVEVAREQGIVHGSGGNIFVIMQCVHSGMGGRESKPSYLSILHCVKFEDLGQIERCYIPSGLQVKIYIASKLFSAH